jgi:hypothetical protein
MSRVLGFKPPRNDVKGEKNPQSKLTEKDVLKIRDMLKMGSMVHEEIGKIFGISRNHIQIINTRKCWKHI